MAEVWEKRGLLLKDIAGRQVHAMLAFEKEEIWTEYAIRARHEFNSLVPGVIDSHVFAN